MARVRVVHDREGKTLTVWFDEPEKEHSCVETGDEVVIIKDRDGRVIGFERLNFVMEEGRAGFSFEAMTL